MISVSVIMPAFNAGKFIAQSIESVIAQTFTGWELLIVDDGSSDNTKDVVLAYAKKDSRVKYFFQTNGRQGKARNRALKEATGKFIAFLDADDLWLPEKLEVQLKAFEQKDVDLVFSDSYIFYDTFDEKCSKVMNTERAEFFGREGVEKFLWGNRVPILTAICKIECLQKVGGFSEVPGIQNAEDYHLWLKLQLAGFKFWGIDETLAAYREHPSSVSGSDKSNYKHVIECLIDLNPKHKFIRPFLLHHIEANLENLYKYTDEQFFASLHKYSLAHKNLMVIFVAKIIILLKGRSWGHHFADFIFKGSSTSLTKKVGRKVIKRLSVPKTGVIENIVANASYLRRRFFGKREIQALKNYKNTPIIINNYNQFKYLLLLIDSLKQRGYHNIYILDNASTYPPLLEFYEKTDVHIIRLDKNIGHMAMWKAEGVLEKFKDQFYVLTDSDVVLSEECPHDFLKTFLKVLIKFSKVTKVGCALRLDDIPDHYPLKEKVLKWEVQFWTNEVFENGFQTFIDTTFALYRPNYEPNHDAIHSFYPGIRMAGKFTAMHGGWYQDPENLSEEEIFYKSTANNSASWSLQNDGQPKESTIKYL